MTTFTENGITYPDEGCVWERCTELDGEPWCYCYQRLHAFQLEAEGRCGNCALGRNCPHHRNGCPDIDQYQEIVFFHTCGEECAA